MARLPPLVLAMFLVSCAPARDAAPRIEGIAEHMLASMPKTPDCGRLGGSAILAPADDQRTGGAVAVAKADDRTVAFIADEDAGLVRTIDVGSTSEIATTEVAGAPSRVLVMRDGRVMVTARNGARVDVLEPTIDVTHPLVHRCSRQVAAEPHGLAATAGDREVLVVSRWGHALAALDGATLDAKYQIDLPRDPTAVIVSADGKRAIVSHAAGERASVVALDGAHDVGSIKLESVRHRLISFLPMDAPARVGPRLRRPDRFETRTLRTTQAFALVRTSGGEILEPDVYADTGNGVRTGGYGDAVTVFGNISTLDFPGALMLSGQNLGSTSLGSLGEEGLPGDARIGDCLAPRAAAFDPKTNRVWVACLGIDAIVAYDTAYGPPHDHEMRRVKVASGPSGVAIDADGRRAIAFSAFASVASVIALDDEKAKPIAIALARRGEVLSDEARLGRRLFHAAGTRTMAGDGRACVSCHPDGRDDGFTWTTPEGLRQTPMLVGRLEGTAPYGWDGAKKDAMGHLGRTMERLGGFGLADREKRAVLAYIATLRPPASPALADARIARGFALFHSETTGCSTCHLGDDTLTDNLAHDVKSHHQGDDGEAFDTPSLKFVGQSAPYFHDGRYTTLGELLAKSDGTMGHTAALSTEDMDSLEAYLRSL